ncbi:hypothetical protein KIN20_005042 [Parelaphostrongylus tenuis]|uniref:ZP domain-containing protein n=1 Tax=Parelaphostrongylus tenuis TaxID=148309 RepID=A0AAD5MS73_PARTN|nr:hypothetical protein KIN20_005042 [Parelaphostrongylus tenuis]
MIFFAQWDISCVDVDSRHLINLKRHFGSFLTHSPRNGRIRADPENCRSLISQKIVDNDDLYFEKSERVVFIIVDGCIIDVCKAILWWRFHGERNWQRKLQAIGEYSIKLIISPVDGLLVDGFTAVSVRCIYSTQEVMLTLPPGPNGFQALHINGPQHDDGVVTGNGVAPLLSMQVLDDHGINGSPLVKASVGQRITLDLVLKDTAIYDFHVHSCYAHDGTNTPDASINIIDSNGYGFQFTSSQFVHFECRVTPCVHTCKRQQCDTDTGKTLLIPALRRRREEAERSGSLKALRMQTVLQIEPQQIQKAALGESPTL